MYFKTSSVNRQVLEFLEVLEVVEAVEAATTETNLLISFRIFSLFSHV